MEAFSISAVTVALAEIGDKTQLLSLFLTLRFRNKPAIVAGILVATLLNHAASAWFGGWLSSYLQTPVGQWGIAIGFILMGAWLLFPDKDDSEESSLANYGAFVASTVLFFIAEIGDKTQVATIILGAQFDNLLWVTMGTTLGMLAANVPVVYGGEYLMKRIPLKLTRMASAAAFVGVGISRLV